MGAISVKEWDTLLEQMDSTLLTESEVAFYIGNSFRELASSAITVGDDLQKMTQLKEHVAKFRTALDNERKKLIHQEVELYAVI